MFVSRTRHAEINFCIVLVWMSPLVLWLRDSVEVIAVCVMPNQIAVDLKQPQVFVEGCACDSCGVLRILRG